MERQDDGHSTGFQDVWQNAIHRFLHVFEFIVDGDSQCLEHASGRMPTASCRRRRDHAANTVSELVSGFDGGLTTLADDLFGDLPGKWFFAVVGQDLCEGFDRR